MKLCRTVYFIAETGPSPGCERVCFWPENSNTKRSRGEDTQRTKYSVAKDRLSSASFVSMVQAAHLRNGNDTTVLWLVHRSGHRRIFGQG